MISIYRFKDLISTNYHKPGYSMPMTLGEVVSLCHVLFTGNPVS